MTPPSVIVTGASGFIGRHITEPLVRRGVKVHEVSRHPRPSRGMVTTHVLDVHDVEGWRRLVRDVRASHLLQMAWSVEHGRFWSAAENVTWALTTVRCVEEFVAAGGRRVVGVGTCAEYAASSGPCVEGVTRLAPSSIYGKAKAAAALLSDAVAQGAGAEAAWARLFHLFGPSEHRERLVPSLVRPLLAGQAAVCRAGNYVRDLLHVVDLGDALAALVLSHVRGDVNIGSGRPTPLANVASEIARRVGPAAQLTIEQREGSVSDPPVLVPDVRRLNEEVGWHCRTPLGDRLEETLAWWRRELAQGARR